MKSTTKTVNICRGLSRIELSKQINCNRSMPSDTAVLPTGNLKFLKMIALERLNHDSKLGIQQTSCSLISVFYSSIRVSSVILILSR